MASPTLMRLAPSAKRIVFHVSSLWLDAGVTLQMMATLAPVPVSEGCAQAAQQKHLRLRPAGTSITRHFQATHAHVAYRSSCMCICILPKRHFQTPDCHTCQRSTLHGRCMQDCDSCCNADCLTSARSPSRAVSATSPEMAGVLVPLPWPAHT